MCVCMCVCVYCYACPDFLRFEISLSTLCFFSPLKCFKS